MDILQELFYHPKSVAVVLISILYLLRLRQNARARSGLPLPPGPKGYPIIGNMFDIPSESPEKAYAELSKQFGDLVYLETMGTRILVLGSINRARDLFDGKSSIYNSRWCMPMLNFMDLGSYFSIQPYGAAWRRQRQLFSEHFNARVVGKYHPMITEEATRYVKDILDKPQQFSERTRSFFTSIILRSMYGIQPKGNDDPFVTIPAKAGLGFAIAVSPGNFFIDIFPGLKYVPDWMPGTGWKQFAKYYREKTFEAKMRPYEYVQSQMKQGTAPMSALRSMIENLPPPGDSRREVEERYAQDTCALGYFAGSDTSLSSSRALLLLLACHPEAQKRAQAEIDEIVGSERLPDFGDREKLVYVNAIIKEGFRMHQPTPLALPHSTTEDDVYDGYFIPKDTIVMGNSWQILHDPKNFPDPFAFEPERFIKDGQLDKDVLDPFGPGFGFGRRICPGRYISIDSVYAMIASTLAVFDIIAPKDEDGNITLRLETTDGIVVAPKPFDCIMQPRSPTHADLIRNLDVVESDAA